VKIEILSSDVSRRLYKLPQAQIGTLSAVVPDLGILLDSDTLVRSSVTKTVSISYAAASNRAPFSVQTRGSVNLKIKKQINFKSLFSCSNVSMCLRHHTSLINLVVQLILSTSPSLLAVDRKRWVSTGCCITRLDWDSCHSTCSLGL